MQNEREKACKCKIIKKPDVFIAAFIFALAVALCLLSVFILSACSTDKVAEERKFEYVYDGHHDGYILSEVLKSDGGRVEIPDGYDGKKVVGVSCGIFADASIKEYEFSSSVFFTDTEKLATADIGCKKLFADRSAIDSIRARLYECTDDDTVRKKTFELANGVIPSGLEDGENYLTFNYDCQAYSFCSGSVLPVFICKNGGSFDLAIYSDIGYVNHCDKSSVSDLDRAYSRTNGYILKDITVDGRSVTGGYTVTENAVATVEFEKVYRIYVNDGNNENYDLTEVQPEFCYDILNGQKLPYRYVAESRAEAFFNGVVMRNGFALNWQYSAHNDGPTAEIKHFNNLLTALNTEKTDLDIYPVWSANAFGVEILSSAENDTITYGENVTFYAKVPDMEGVSLTYEWRHNGETVGKESALELVRPSLSEEYDGIYAVSVGIAGGEYSVISAYAEICLTILKRSVPVKWSDGAITYNGSIQTPSAEASGIFGEELGLLISGGGVNAGEHYAEAQTNSYDYVLENATANFTIGKAELVAKPRDCTVVYGDNPEANGVEFFGFIGADGEETIKGTAAYSFTNTRSQVGIYAGCVCVSGLSANNYEITYKCGNLKIIHRGVELSWSGADNLVYDGYTHCVTATVTDKIADDDLYVSVIGGEAVNAGNYIAVATLCGADRENYCIKAFGTLAFCVAKAECPLAVELADTVYGEALKPSVSGNLGNGAVKFTYGDGKSEGNISRLDAGMHHVVAQVEETENYKGATAVSPFKIIPREVSFLWKNCKELIYDATAKNITAESVGVLDGDSVRVQVSGGNAVAAGSYIAEAYLVGDDAFNYKLPQLRICAYYIEKCKLSITAENKSSVYAEDLKELTAVVEGTIYNEEVSFQLRKEIGVNAGVYRIEVIIGEYGNYDITAVSASYVIEKATSEITGVAGGKFTLDGFVAFGTVLGELTGNLPLPSLSGNWAWSEGDNCKVGKIGRVSHLATFKPTDSLNYNDVTVEVIANVKYVNDFTVTLGSDGEFFQYTDSGEPFVIKWNGAIAVIDYMVSGSWGDEVQGDLNISITRADGTAAGAEWNADNIEILIMEEGTYTITFTCSGNEEYLSGSVSITVIVE